MDKKPEHKPAPKPRKPKVDIEKLAQARAEEILKEREQYTTLKVEEVGTRPIVASVPETTPAPEHHAPIEDAEEKAIGIWGKVKAWKWFWFVVGAIALILVVLGYQWVNNVKNKKADAKIEKKKEELQKIIVGGDTTLLMQNEIMAKRILRGDSMVDFVIHAAVDLKKALDYSKSIMPKRLLSIDQETIKTSEKINNPANTDDDVRRNADEQLSKPVIRQR